MSGIPSNSESESGRTRFQPDQVGQIETHENQQREPEPEVVQQSRQGGQNRRTWLKNLALVGTTAALTNVNDLYAYATSENPIIATTAKEVQALLDKGKKDEAKALIDRTIKQETAKLTRFGGSYKTIGKLAEMGQELQGNKTYRDRFEEPKPEDIPKDEADALRKQISDLQQQLKAAQTAAQPVDKQD